MSLAILQADETVRAVEATLPGALADIGLRLRTLLADTGDAKYSHPHDPACAAYAWALRHDDTVRTAVCQALHPAVAATTPDGLCRLWHTRYVYEELQAGRLANASPTPVPPQAAAHMAAALVRSLWTPDDVEEPEPWP